MRKHRRIFIIFVLALFAFFSLPAQCQWEQSSGLAAKKISALAVNGNNVYAGSDADSGGIFLSTDNGANWTDISPTNRAPVFAIAAYDSFIITGASGYIWVSTNNGVNWTWSNSGFTVSFSNSIISILMERGGAIFAGGGWGIGISTDNGKNWTIVDSVIESRPKRPFGQIRSFATMSSDIFAGDDGGVYLSTNKGLNWAALDDSGMFFPQVLSMAVRGSTIFAGGSYGYIYLSTNNGKYWTIAKRGLGTTVEGPIISLVESEGYVFAAGGLTPYLYVSKDNDTIWAPVAGFNAYPLCLAASNGYLFAGTFGGVFRLPISKMTTLASNKKSQRDNSIPTHLQVHHQGQLNSNISIEFSVPYSAKVAIRIYDPSGRIVQSLVNSYLQSGSHSVTWNTGNIASGCYSIKMQAGNNIYVKNIPILR